MKNILVRHYSRNSCSRLSPFLSSSSSLLSLSSLSSSSSSSFFSSPLLHHPRPLQFSSIASPPSPSSSPSSSPSLSPISSPSPSSPEGGASGSSSGSGGGSSKSGPNKKIIYSSAFAALIIAGCSYYYFTELDNEYYCTGLRFSQFYYHYGRFFRRFVDAETGHHWAIRAFGLSPTVRRFLGLIEKDNNNNNNNNDNNNNSNNNNDPDANILSYEAFNFPLSSPIGLAAGFDKNGASIEGLIDAGFSMIEIGSITPLPQSGNDKPRIFRLEDDMAVINRYGFNSDGAEAVEQNLIELFQKIKNSKKKDNDNNNNATNGPSKHFPCSDAVLGINLGKNKLQTNASLDYCSGIHRFYRYADYFVINVSSPNTPGLRNLQAKQQLKELIIEVLKARDQQYQKELNEIKENNNNNNKNNNGGIGGIGKNTTTNNNTHPSIRRVPVFVKIAPDLSIDDRNDIAELSLSLSSSLDGLIISNTTIDRPSTLRSDPSLTSQTGGLSGAPLMDKSTELLRDMYIRTEGRIPLIGVGGVGSAEDAYRKIKNGATVVQCYSIFALKGPYLITEIKRGLIDLVKKDGYKNIKEAIGADVKKDIENKIKK